MSGKQQTKKKCGKCPEESVPLQAHNSPDWYTRDIVPQIGANFDVLSTIRAENDFFGSSGISARINAAGVFTTPLAPPVDQYGSFYAKVAELYAEIRKSNSGAANYTPGHLMAYIMNVVTLRTLAHEGGRVLRATRASGPYYAESPYIFTALCGEMKFNVASASYANDYNQFAILMADIEALPIVPLSVMDRWEMFVTTIFQDSETTRPALFTVAPSAYFEYDYDTTEGKVTATVKNHAVYQTNKAQECMACAQALYNKIATSYIYTIIRGDLIKAFGPSAFRRNLITTLNAPIQVGYNADLMAQIENATVIGDDNNNSFTLAFDAAGIGDLKFTTKDKDNRWGAFGLAKRPINFHGTDAPSGGELLSITRLMASGSYDSGYTTGSISDTSGIVFMDFLWLSGVDYVGIEVTPVGGIMKDLHSTVQSTCVAAYQQVAWLSSVIDHFPMIVHTSGNAKGCSYAFDVDNFAILGADDQKNLTRIANRSLGAFSNSLQKITAAINSAKSR